MATRGTTEKITADHLALAHALADAAGAILRRHFRQPLAVDDKSDLSPVTIADREAEAAMRQLIADAFPQHGILGEELGAVRADAEWVWVLDPIDGTKSFICGIPLFGTLIALAHRGSPVLGVIDQPVLRERWLGRVGETTRFNGAAIHTRPCSDLAAATLFATAPEMFEGAESAGFARLKGAVKRVRYGADCYAYAQLAGGFIDLVVERDLKPYAFCALAPVIAGAGGSIADWQGKPLTLQSDGRVIACGDPRLAVPVRAVLQG